MTRFMYLLALAASVILAAGAATAAGGTRPDDRATHGPGSIGIAQTTAPIRPDDRANHGPGAFVRDTSSEIVRPDDRAWRGAGPAPTVAIVESPSVRVDGFDWADAGIGAAAAFGFGLLLVGASALVRRRQSVAAVS
jgi:hypothetical protein